MILVGVDAGIVGYMGKLMEIWATETSEHPPITRRVNSKTRVPTDQQPLREPENLYKLGYCLTGNKAEKRRISWQCILQGVYVLLLAWCTTC